MYRASQVNLRDSVPLSMSCAKMESTLKWWLFRKRGKSFTLTHYKYLDLTSYSKPEPFRGGGGVGFYTKTDLNAKMIENLSTSTKRSLNQ